MKKLLIPVYHFALVATLAVTAVGCSGRKSRTLSRTNNVTTHWVSEDVAHPGVQDGALPEDAEPSPEETQQAHERENWLSSLVPLVLAVELIPPGPLGQDICGLALTTQRRPGREHITVRQGAGSGHGPAALPTHVPWVFRTTDEARMSFPVAGGPVGTFRHVSFTVEDLDTNGRESRLFVDEGANDSVELVVTRTRNESGTEFRASLKFVESEFKTERSFVLSRDVLGRPRALTPVPPPSDAPPLPGGEREFPTVTFDTRCQGI